jgi:hypothetical protein
VKATHANQEFADKGAAAAIKMGRPKRVTSITADELAAFAVAKGAYYDEPIDGGNPVRKLVVRFKGNGGQHAYTLQGLRSVLVEARQNATMH